MEQASKTSASNSHHVLTLYFQHGPKHPHSSRLLLFHYCDKTTEVINLRRREGSCWLMASEIWVPAQLTLLLWGPMVRPTHHAGAYVGKQSCSPHGSQKTREHGSSSPCAHERTPFLPQGSTPNDPPLHRLAAKPVNTDPLETPVHSKVRVSPSLPVDMTHAWPSSTSAHSLCFKAVSLYPPLLR